MYIGIDGNEANIKERVGVNQYALELLEGFHKINDNLIKKDNYIIYLKESPFIDLPKENNYWKYKVISGERFWIVKKLTPYLIFKEKLDVFFSPNHYLPFVPGLSKVLTIHDLGYLNFSEQFTKRDYWQLKYWTAISLYVSKRIIAVSDFTKKDIVRHYPAALGKIDVVHHGVHKNIYNNNISLTVVRRIKEKYKLPKKYILFLSTLKPSKNIEGLVKAFYKITKLFPDYRLVISGKKGWMYESIYKLVKNIKLENKIIFTGYVNEEDKPAIIKGATLFCLPSFWEGFGMDVVNALACGVPVLISTAACLPEVAGKAATYIDPESTASIEKGIIKVLSMKKAEYNKIVNEGLLQAEKYNWNDTVKKTLEIIKGVGMGV